MNKEVSGEKVKTACVQLSAAQKFRRCWLWLNAFLGELGITVGWCLVGWHLVNDRPVSAWGIMVLLLLLRIGNKLQERS